MVSSQLHRNALYVDACANEDCEQLHVERKPVDNGQLRQIDRDVFAKCLEPALRVEVTAGDQPADQCREYRRCKTPCWRDVQLVFGLGKRAVADDDMESLVEYVVSCDRQTFQSIGKVAVRERDDPAARVFDSGANGSALSAIPRE